MTDFEVDSYLQKEIGNSASIVTYRLLSRKCRIHVNAAKNALASFYERRRANKEAIYATFWLSGETTAHSMNATGDEMEVDSESGGGEFLARKVLIVGEEDLESAKAAFSKIYVLHVYSISAVPLISASLLCKPSGEVRELDKTGGDEFARTVGKVISHQVKHGATTEKRNNVSVPVKPRASTSAIAKPEPKETSQKKLKPSQSLVAADHGKPKATGKLSWTKAKPKDGGKEPPLTKTRAEIAEVKKEPATGGDEKRGTKRKSDVMTQIRGRQEEEESEDEPVSKPGKEPAVLSKVVAKDVSVAARIKKGVVLSDDEESLPAKANTSTRGRLRTTEVSDTERSVRAMMDIDDTFVTKASTSIRAAANQDGGEEPPTTDHNDSEMDEDSDDPAPQAKPRKRKQKKEVPIGRNGLRKRRVVKSKTDFDEKGYMVTVDYSSYESVDEEEEPKEDRKSRPKLKSAAGKRKNSTQRKGEGDKSASESDAAGQKQKGLPPPIASKKPEGKKPSARTSLPKDRQTNGSQKNLASFFGNGGGKSKK